MLSKICGHIVEGTKETTEYQKQEVPGEKKIVLTKFNNNWNYF
jgi:hypothetical protein